MTVTGVDNNEEHRNYMLGVQIRKFPIKYIPIVVSREEFYSAAEEFFLERVPVEVEHTSEDSYLWVELLA